MLLILILWLSNVWILFDNLIEHISIKSDFILMLLLFPFQIAELNQHSHSGSIITTIRLCMCPIWSRAGESHINKSHVKYTKGLKKLHYRKMLTGLNFYGCIHKHVRLFKLPDVYVIFHLLPTTRFMDR